MGWGLQSMKKSIKNKAFSAIDPGLNEADGWRLAAAASMRTVVILIGEHHYEYS